MRYEYYIEGVFIDGEPLIMMRDKETDRVAEAFIGEHTEAEAEAHLVRLNNDMNEQKIMEEAFESLEASGHWELEE